MQLLGPTLLVDGDPNRSSLHWARHGKLPVKVIDEKQLARYARDYEHIVTDSEAHPDLHTLKQIAEGSDLLVVPSNAEELAVDALTKALSDLQTLGNDRWKILQTMVLPLPNKDAYQLRDTFKGLELPYFQSWIRFRSAFRKATAEGIPVYDVKDPRASEAWSDYEEVGKEILQ